MTGTICSCTRPIKDNAFLCGPCTKALEQDLNETPALADELETTRTRQSRTGGPGIGIVVRTERPVPWNDKAARVAVDLNKSLAGWVLLCAGLHVTTTGPACGHCYHPSCATLRASRPPAPTAAALSRYLLAALPGLRHKPEVVTLADDLHRLHTAARFVIDRRAEQTFYGPCNSVVYIDGQPDPNCPPCPIDLYAPEGATDLTCPDCKTVHQLADKRAGLVAAAQDQLASAPVLSRFLSAYGEPLREDRIRQWKKRGLLAAHGTNPAGQPVYRVSEVVELLTQMNEKRTTA